MTTERDLRTRTVLSWLREDLHENAERVLLRALDDVDTTPQRRSWWPAWRSLDMNNLVRYAIAAAAVLVVALVGYQLLPSNIGSGGETPVPSATVMPSATLTSSPTEIPRLPLSGPIDAGTYRMGTGPTFLVTVPQGWTSTGGTQIIKNLEQPNEVTALELYSADIQVFADACQSEGTEELIGPTTDDLLAALLAQENSDISDPVDVTIGGLPGKRFEVSVPDGIDIALCSIGSLQIWVDSAGSYLAGVGLDDSPSNVAVADAPGGRLLLTLPLGDAPAADIAERDAIIASIEIVE
jgi:hypothetical protein